VKDSMRQICLRAMLGVLLLMPVHCARAGGQDPDESFFRTYYLPPEDPQPKRLYGKIIPFLERVHELPEQIQLRMTPSRLPEAKELQESTHKASKKNEGWKQVVPGRVFPSEKRAYALLRAGHWAEAACAYRGLHRRDPGCAHWKVMLALCEARSGNREEARHLLKQAAEERDTLEPWVQWIMETEELFSGEETQ